MKKTILLLALFCVYVCANAQFKSGDVLLGGSLSFGTANSNPSVNNNYTKSTNIYVNPTVGFFKNEKTLYSFGVIYGYNSYESPSNNTSGIQKNTGNNYGLNFSKQCFMPIAKNFYFVMGGVISALYIDNKSIDSQSPVYQTNKNGQFAFGLQPGVSYKLTKKILFDVYIPNIFSVNYTTGTQHNFAANGGDTKYTNNSFNFYTNLNNNLFNNFNFGIRFLLNKKS